MHLGTDLIAYCQQNYGLCHGYTWKALSGYWWSLPEFFLRWCFQDHDLKEILLPVCPPLLFELERQYQRALGIVKQGGPPTLANVSCKKWPLLVASTCLNRIHLDGPWCMKFRDKNNFGQFCGLKHNRLKKSTSPKAEKCHKIITGTSETWRWGKVAAPGPWFKTSCFPTKILRSLERVVCVYT